MKVILYKKDAKGKVRVWSVETYDYYFITSSGLIDGEKRTDRFDISHGLAGRTVEQQVELRANAKIQKKLDNGYTDNIENISDVVKNQMGFEKQMKAVLLRDGNHPDVNYDGNVFCQRKYNGHRCTIAKLNGAVTAYSSGGKPITSISHILGSIRLEEGQKLDGELYVHGLSLQKISSKVRKQNVTDEDLKFICFDQISNDPFNLRIRDVLKQSSIHIVMAETIRVHNFDQVKKLFFKFRAEGYEGAMLRHGDMGYEAGRRSKQIYKIKKLDGEGYYDAEFKVIGVVASVEGWGRLVCITESGERFRVSAPGDHYEKRDVLENIENYIGKYVKCEFPEWTDSGKPSQPVAIMWREKDE